MTSTQYQRIISTLSALKQTYTDRRVLYIGRYDANGRLEANPTSGLPVGYVWVHDGSTRAVSRAKNISTEYAAGLPVIVAWNTETQEDEVIGVDPSRAIETHGSSAAGLNSPRKSVGVPTPVSALDMQTGLLAADSAVGGLTMRILPTWTPGGAWWDGSTLIDVTPTATSDQQSFAVVFIDPQSVTASSVLTTDRALSVPLLNADRTPTVQGAADIKAVKVANPTLWAVGAVLLRDSTTAIDPTKIVDTRFWNMPTFTGADGSTAGTTGFVPAPAAADNEKYLKGDGTYDTPTASIDITALTETTTIDGAADFLVVYDASATANRKVKPDNLPGGGGSGDCLLFTHEEAANTNGGTATSGSRQTRRLNYKRHDTGTNGSIIELAFTSGGTYEIVVGDTITGATSSATATVFDVVLTSGTWAGGDAAGTLWLNDQTGTFQSENLNVGASSNVATIAGNSTSANYRFRLATGTYRLRGEFQFYDTGQVRIWLYNVTDAADQAGVYGHCAYTSSAGAAAVSVALCGRFTIAAAKTFQVEYRCAVTSSATDGQGVSNNYGGNEIYATMDMVKE